MPAMLRLSLRLLRNLSKALARQQSHRQQKSLRLQRSLRDPQRLQRKQRPSSLSPVRALLERDRAATGAGHSTGEDQVRAKQAKCPDCTQ